MKLYYLWWMIIIDSAVLVFNIWKILLEHSHICKSNIVYFQDGETIPDGKCATLTCNNGVVTRKHVKCEDAPVPVCVNQYPAKLVKDDSGCCSKYECQCK